MLETGGRVFFRLDKRRGGRHSRVSWRTYAITTAIRAGRNGNRYRGRSICNGKAALHVLIKRGVFSRLLGWLKNRPSSARSIPSFVEEYGINMEDSLKGVGEFRHFNDFFYRRLKPGARPLAGGEDTAVFPADARHMGWERADRIKNVFVKGQRFDLPSLLGSDTLAERYVPGVFSARGAEKGYFAFGGSTVMCFFEPGKVSLASDLLEKTEEGLELFARQGDMMGTAAT